MAAGCHLEGPFISTKKKGAHPQDFIRTFSSAGVEDLMEVYGTLDNVAIVTLAPELAGSQSVVTELSKRGITVSLGEHRLLDQSDSRTEVSQDVFFSTTVLLTQILPPGSVLLLKVTLWPTCPKPRTLFSMEPPSSLTSSTPCCL